jgi:hypothetical protein
MNADPCLQLYAVISTRVRNDGIARPTGSPRDMMTTGNVIVCRSSCKPRKDMPGGTNKTPSRPKNAPFKITSAAKGFKEPRDDCGRSLNKILVRVDYEMRKHGLS